MGFPRRKGQAGSWSSPLHSLCDGVYMTGPWAVAPRGSTYQVLDWMAVQGDHAHRGRPFMVLLVYVLVQKWVMKKPEQREPEAEVCLLNPVNDNHAEAKPGRSMLRWVGPYPCL